MSDTQLFPLRFHDKWILIDQNAHIHPLDVEPVLIKDAGEDTFLIETDTGFGLIDSGLNWLIHPENELQAKRQFFTNKTNEGLVSKYSTFFSYGLSTAQDVEGKYGYIDKNGNWVIKPGYNSAVRFSEGLASVMNDGLWGVIDSEGRLIIDYQFANQVFFKNGYATMYRKGSNLYGGIVDKTGKILLNEQFYDNKGFSEGLMPAGKTKKYGYYDLSGKAVFPEIFEKASLFVDGRATVSFRGKYGVIDKEGNFIIQPVFDDIGTFMNGIASAQVGWKYGFIDISGKFVIAPVFNQAYDFAPSGLVKVLVSKLFKYENEPIMIHNNYYHYINTEGKFVHPEKPDFDIISVEQWKQENPEAVAALSVKVIDDLSEYLYLNETKINQETENAINERQQNEKTAEIELKILKFNDLLKVPYFVLNFVSAIWFGFNCSMYSPLEYPQVWHRFIFLGIFAIFGYFSGKTFAEYQYIEGNHFSWKNREGYLGGLLLLIMGLGYFFNITKYLKAVFTIFDFVSLLAFFITTGMTLGNIFRRMAAELMPSNQKGLQLVVGILIILSLLNAIMFSSDTYSPHGVLGISALIAVPAGIIWIFLSNRKPEHEVATSLWNAFYFGSNSASYTTRSFYKKHYTERQFREWDEKQTTYTFDGDERSIAASRGGVGVVCIFFTNLVILSSPWFLVALVNKVIYLYYSF